MEAVKSFPNVINVATIKDGWDYFYILITSVVTSVIAVGVWRVAYLQMKTLKQQVSHEAFVNVERLKVDLFEKRFSVFSATREVLLFALREALQRFKWVQCVMT